MDTRSSYSAAVFNDRKSFAPLSDSKYLSTMSMKKAKEQQELSAKLTYKNKAALSLYSASRFENAQQQRVFEGPTASGTVKFSERCSRIQRHVDDISVSHQSCIDPICSRQSVCRRQGSTQNSSSRLIRWRISSSKCLTRPSASLMKPMDK